MRRNFVVVVLVVMSLVIVNSSWNMAQEDEESLNYALIVGIGDYNGDGKYDGKNDLYGPPNDIEKVRNALLIWGFRNQEIKVLKDKEATKEEIKKELEILKEKAKNAEHENCCFFFYFAGHGLKRDDTDKPEKGDPDSKEGDRKDEGIRAFGGKAGKPEDDQKNTLWDDEFRELVKDLECKGHVIFEFDCCFAEGMKDFEVKKNMFVGWSAEENECACELSFNSSSNSVWSHFVFKEALGNADSNKDGRVSIEEANRYGKEKVPRYFVEHYVKLAQGIENSANEFREIEKKCKEDQDPDSAEFSKRLANGCSKLAEACDEYAKDCRTLADKLEKKDGKLQEDYGKLAADCTKLEEAFTELAKTFLEKIRVEKNVSKALSDLNFATLLLTMAEKCKMASDGYDRLKENNFTQQNPGYADGDPSQDISCLVFRCNTAKEYR